MSSYHVSVLLHEAIEGLNINPDGVYVDVTFGAGGHSKEILKHLKQGSLVAFDQDEDAEANLIEDERLVFVRQNFKYLKNHLRANGFLKVDGVLADLGVSSHQFDIAERGFSTRFDGGLDMRMDQDSTLTAAQVINDYEPEQLSSVFQIGADIKNPQKLVDRIVEARAQGEIKTTGELKSIISSMAHPSKVTQFLAKVFQAVRIEVNGEVEVLKKMLEQAVQVLKPGGRLVVISYHSLEDRLVKNLMRAGNFEGQLDKDFYGNIIRPLEPVNRKVIVPSEEEMEVNSRARSAKMRVATKLSEPKQYK